MSKHTPGPWVHIPEGSIMTSAIIAIVLYIAFVAIVVRCLRANGDDTDADEAADSVRQALDPDARLDELRDYTRPHIKAGTAYGKEVL